MDRQTFDRILVEEGIDDVSLGNDLWKSKPGNDLNEERLRFAARQFRKSVSYQIFLTRKALNDAMDREFGPGR